jgi:hypothetical protein
MNTRDAANRSANVWAQGRPAKGGDGMVELQGEDGGQRASMFRPFEGVRGDAPAYRDVSPRKPARPRSGSATPG